MQRYFRSKGYDVFGNAVFDGDVLVGTLQKNGGCYTFLTFQEPEFQNEVSRAKQVAEEYSLPVIQDAKRLYVVNDGR